MLQPMGSQRVRYNRLNNNKGTDELNVEAIEPSGITEIFQRALDLGDHQSDKRFSLRS